MSKVNAREDATTTSTELESPNENAALSRRGFLGASAGALAILPALAPSPARAAAAMNHGAAHGMAGHAMATGETVPGNFDLLRAPYEEGAPLVEPEVRRAVSGELSTTLRVAYTYRDVGGFRLYVRSYEGTVPGPTLRLAPGDTLKINLINDLPPNRDPSPAYIDQPHRLNTTNFHFHGAHVSPGGISDNVMRSMEPGLSHPIEITLPDDHPRGSYWYHPHHHGSADVQLASGMVGAVVIEGDFDDVPEIAAARERVLVLSEIVHDAFGMIEGFETLFPETAARFFTINGQRAPEISMRPGEVQRWRLFHTGYQDDFFLRLEGHKLLAIARDGMTLPNMGTTEIRSDAKSTAVPDAMLIAPGQRIDVLVKAGAPGVYELAGLPYNQGYPSPTGLFARIKVEGEPMEMSLPASLPPAPFPDIRDDEITGSRTLTFSAITPEVDAAGHWQEFKFLVDGKVFDMNRIDQRVKLGAVEEWTIVNAHRDDHIFHIHVNPFQLVKVNGEPVEPVWLDTAVLPSNGSITFRSRFLDFAGTFMLHCHMMNHEELGMMQVVEVYTDG